MFNRATLQAKPPDQSKNIPKQADCNRPPLALSVKEMAAELRISEKTAYQLVHQPDFPAAQIGGRYIVYYKGLQEWLEAQSKKLSPAIK